MKKILGNKFLLTCIVMLYNNVLFIKRTYPKLRLLEKSLSCEMVVLKYDVSNSAVVTWVDKIRQFGYQSLAEVKKRGRPPKDMERPKKQKPQTELEKLQEENALLKKVKALVEEIDAQLRETGRKPSKN